MDEAEVLRRTHGTFKLGIQFRDWGRIGDAYMHAFGGIGAKLGGLDFHHYWLRGRAEDVAGGLWDYSLNETAALAGRFDHLERIPDSTLGGLVYAYHFDAAQFAVFLREYAEARGVRRTEGKVVDVALRAEDGFIESVRLADGPTVAGDLFIDCSGFRGLLIEDALETGYEDWSLWLPCDRAVAVPCAAAGPPRPYTQATALKAGWQWRIPLQHRVGNGHVFASAYLGEDEATAMLLDNLEGPPLAEPKVLRFKTGRRKKFWNRNCVALGLASGFMEPLESTSIHLIQTGVSRLLEYFPRKGMDRVDVDEYNRRCTWEFERIRDFLILHYHLNQRTDSPFWVDRRRLPVPAELQRRMDLFAGNGRIHREFDELFTEVAWLQVMVGQGLQPASWHPLADRIDRAQLQRFLGNVKTIIGGAVNRLSSHADFVARYCAAA
jgi:tryptophan halogenase